MIKKHSWNSYGRVAYGLLGGLRQTISCAVPIASVQGQVELDLVDADSRIVEIASNVMRTMGVDLIGRYASSGMGLEEIELTYNRSYRLFAEFYMMCCPNCSSARYFLDGKPVKWGNWTCLHGARLTNAFNQRRLLQKINDKFGRSTYLDPITVVDTSA